MRSSVAGDIVRSADSSPLNTDPFSPTHPYRGMPNIPGLIIPDKWKSDLPPSQKVILCLFFGKNNFMRCWHYRYSLRSNLILVRVNYYMKFEHSIGNGQFSGWFLERCKWNIWHWGWRLVVNWINPFCWSCFLCLFMIELIL